MRKILEEASPTGPGSASEGWLDLARIAVAELSSEDPQYPIENALEMTSTDGFRAAKPGPQRIRLIFDHPQTIRRIRLEFQEASVERSQEFVLSATSKDGTRRELVRQQWTFSPGGSTSEIEEYVVGLHDIMSVELMLDPGRHDKTVLATLHAFRIA